MEVRIRISAAVDQSLRSAFKPLVLGAIEARRLIMREFEQVPREIAAAFGGLGRAQGGTFKGVAAAARTAYREQAQLARQAAREQIQAAKAAERAAVQLERERVAATRAANREMLQEHRRLEREQRRIASETARAARRQHVELDRFASRTSYHAARFITPHMPIASVARRAGAEVIRGFGIDPTFSGAMQRNIEIETRAGALTNQARLSGQDIAVKEVQDRVAAVGGKYGIKRDQVMGALEQLQALTGDLPMALSLLDKLGERAIVSGSKMDDFAGMVGNVVNQMEGVEDKGAAALRVADAFAAQGARGAVEVPAMARYTALIAPQANKFAGNTEENLKELGAFVQVAREKGGATSAAESARSIARFATTFRTSARLAEFERITGKSAFADEGRTILRGPRELIKDALVGTRGNQQEFNKIFMNIIGAKPADALLTSFNQAGGGAAGIAAVDAALDKFKRDLELTDEVVRKNLDTHNKLRGTQVEKFQQQLDLVADELAGEILPKLVEAQPSIIKFVKAMADAASWAIQNPGMMITAAIVASIARAGIESALRAALERTILAVGAHALGGGVPAVPTGGAPAADAPKKFGKGFQGAMGTAVVGGAVLAGLAVRAARQDIGANEVSAKGFGKGLAFETALGLAPLLAGGVGSFAHVGLGVNALFGERSKPRGQMLARDKSGFEFKKLEDEAVTYRAKDPNTTQEQLRAAYARGGLPELEKLATATQKQENWSQKLFEQSERQTEFLSDIRDSLNRPAGDDAPTIDPNGAGYQQ